MGAQGGAPRVTSLGQRDDDLDFARVWREGVGAGLSTQQIADQLGVSKTSMFARRRRVERRLGVSLEAGRLIGGVEKVVSEPQEPTVEPPEAVEVTPAAELLRRENESLKAENRRLSREDSDLRIIRHIIGTIDQKLDAKPSWVVEAPRAGKLVHGIPTLMLSDLHFGEVVYGSQVNNVNQYNTDIAKTRLKRVVEGSVKLLRHTLAPGEFGGMVVVLGGDMVDGVIHDELREAADETVMESVITLHDELVPALKRLCDEFGRLHVPCVAGNHGRLDRKPRMKNGVKLNFDWLLYHFIARTIANDTKYRDKITFQIPDGFDCSYSVYGTRYMLTHGDSFKGGGGITGPLLPWMRGDMKTRKAYSAVGMPYSHLVMGHWHQLRYLGQIIVNGSLVGYNEYALKSRFDFEPPQQALWLTHPLRGLTFQEGVFAEDPKPVPSSDWVKTGGV